MKPETFRTIVKWFGILIAANLVANLAYILLISRIIEPMWEDAPPAAGRTLLLFGVVFQVIMILFHTKIESSFVSYRDDLYAAMKEPGFSIIGYYVKNYLTDHLIKAGMFALFSLPLTASVAAQGLDFTQPTILELYYIMSTGAYAVAGNAFVGFILNALLFAVLFVGLSFGTLYLTKRDKEVY
jgi:hypothetical protein